MIRTWPFKLSFMECIGFPGIGSTLWGCFPVGHVLKAGPIPFKSFKSLDLKPQTLTHLWVFGAKFWVVNESSRPWKFALIFLMSFCEQKTSTGFIHQSAVTADPHGSASLGVSFEQAMKDKFYVRGGWLLSHKTASLIGQNKTCQISWGKWWENPWDGGPLAV